MRKINLFLDKWVTDNMGRILIIGALVVLTVSMAGCTALLVGAGVGAGAAGVAYVKGDLESDVKADPKEIEKASLKAFEVLDIHKISSSASALDASIIGRTATDKSVKIVVKAKETGGSRISIRVGTFGSESMSRKIYDEIKKMLP